MRCGYFWATSTKTGINNDQQNEIKRKKKFVLSFHSQQHPSAIKSKGCLHVSKYFGSKTNSFLVDKPFQFISINIPNKQHSMCQNLQKKVPRKEKETKIACLQKIPYKIHTDFYSWVECRIGIFLIMKRKKTIKQQRSSVCDLFAEFKKKSIFGVLLITVWIFGRLRCRKQHFFRSALSPLVEASMKKCESYFIYQKWSIWTGTHSLSWTKKTLLLTSGQT